MDEKQFTSRLEHTTKVIKKIMKDPVVKTAIKDFAKILEGLAKEPDTATTLMIKFYASIIPEAKWNEIFSITEKYPEDSK